MLNSFRLLVIVLIALLAYNLAYADANLNPVAIVNGISIPQERIDVRISSFTAKGQSDSPDLRKNILEDLINVEVMSQEAVKMSLDKQSKTLQQLELARQAVLVDAFVQNYIVNFPAEGELTIQKKREALQKEILSLRKKAEIKIVTPPPK